ncbi:MAG: CHAT domain-containing protein, partial [Rheinheimera sp.]
SKTNHFNYFANLSTANAMLEALIKANPLGFAQIGPMSQKGQDVSGSRGYYPNILPPNTIGSKDKPLVLVLPGITGSHLKRGTQREWLAIHRAFGLLDSIKIDTPDIEPDGLIETYYQNLVEQLAEHYEVLSFAFDWRLSLKDSAARLAAVLKQQLSYRSSQPIHLVAHSMGSQVFRVLQLEHNAIWQQWLQRTDTRVVLLGPPNQGSWAPLMMLTGDDVMAKLLSGLAGDFDTLHTRQQICGFQGLLEMQAGMLDRHYPLSALINWQRLADLDKQVAERRNPWFSRVSQAHIWATPTQRMLDDIVQLRVRLDAQYPELQKFKDKICIILGSSDETPCGVIQDPLRGVEFEFTKAGDGRVTWDNAIIEDIPCWLSKAEHGDLAKDKEVITACLNIFAKQPVSQGRGLTPFSRQQRGEFQPEQIVWRQARQPGLSDSALHLIATTDSLALALSRSVFTLPRAGSELPPLQLEVHNGDLRFIGHPLLLGHQISLELTGSEFVVNQLLGGDLTRALRSGVYPALPGQFQVFHNRQVNSNDPLAFPKPRAAIVVGLGDEGDLTPAEIQQSVYSGVVGYCLQVDGPAQGIVLAATTLGSGGILTVSQSVEALVQGVLNANQKLTQLTSSRTRAASWIAKLVIVEQFHNRAVEAWHKLHSCQTLSRSMTIELSSYLAEGQGAVSKPVDGHYRGAKYDLIRITERSIDSEYLTLEFALFTRRARSEIYFKKLQKGQIKELLKNAQAIGSFDRELARTLFQLIFPHELKAALRTAGDVVLELDEKTACYPWEMLDDRDDQQWQAAEKTWALAGEGALLRKFRTASFRRQPEAALSSAVLVIGEPISNAAPLPGAVAEARQVAALFKSSVKLLLHSSSTEVFKAALAGEWQIIHLAGHGVYQPAGPTSAGKAGLVLENGIIFGPAEFESMETVPELVFVNCCELGKIDGDQPSSFPDFAANIAEQLLRNGVRCVVAAGWAVGDHAALQFATAFYDALTGGMPFGTAVQLGRQAAFAADRTGNTWSAYQCYGEPGWRLSANTKTTQPLAEQVMASATELLVALEMLKTGAMAAELSRKDELRTELNRLLRQQPQEWLNQGRIAEAIGQVWLKLGEKDQAFHWYTQAVHAPDGSAGFAAYEQQLNLDARLNEDNETTLLQVVKQLIAFLTVAETSERWCLLGSAYKRLVMKADIDSNADAKNVAIYLSKMTKAYRRGAELPCNNPYYPLWNEYLARLRLFWLGKLKESELPNSADWQQLGFILQEAASHSPDFWNHIGQIELRICQALVSNNLSEQITDIIRQLTDLQLVVNNTMYWRSVYDTATFLLPHYHAKTELADEQQAAVCLRHLLKQLSE